MITGEAKGTDTKRWRRVFSLQTKGRRERRISSSSTIRVFQQQTRQLRAATQIEHFRIIILGSRVFRSPFFLQNLLCRRTHETKGTRNTQSTACEARWELPSPPRKKKWCTRCAPSRGGRKAPRAAIRKRRERCVDVRRHPISLWDRTHTNLSCFSETAGEACLCYAGGCIPQTRHSGVVSCKCCLKRTSPR
jgi:hypothetical protein